MQFKSVALISATTLVTAVSASGYMPGEVWSTLTPDATYAGAITDYTSTFGIAVQPISTSVSSKSVAKRNVEVVSQIGDGQVQETTSTIKATSTVKQTAAAVSQIGDGQVQETTSTAKVTKTSTAAAVSQIRDGQIQATSTASSKTITKSFSGVSQVSDGQIQATTSSATRTTLTPSSSGSVEINEVSCKSSDTLAMTIKDGVLTDAKGRIGSIVANRQFQFDGPPPQAGAIYAGGWSITPEGNLAIGDNDVFYQCLSGNFYNLYDESIGAQCSPIHLEVVSLVDC